MREKANMRQTIFVVVGALMLLVFLFAGNLTWRFFQEKSLAKADELELSATYDRWVEAGRPGGEELLDFMKGRRSDLVLSNRHFTVAGTNYWTQFAITQPKPESYGILFVTTNKVLFWLDSLGQVRSH